IYLTVHCLYYLTLFLLTWTNQMTPHIPDLISVQHYIYIYIYIYINLIRITRYILSNCIH
ncbi:hypothetical protein K6L59_03075, partial [Candidatus Phytoplasma sp. Tabriz.2]|nr:hypothetical protein [Candidatus Phytoplasma australiense]